MDVILLAGDCHNRRIHTFYYYGSIVGYMPRLLAIIVNSRGPCCCCCCCCCVFVCVWFNKWKFPSLWLFMYLWSHIDNDVDNHMKTWDLIKATGVMTLASQTGISTKCPATTTSAFVYSLKENLTLHWQAMESDFFLSMNRIAFHCTLKPMTSILWWPCAACKIDWLMKTFMEK